MKVFLGGTCNGYNWRKELIDLLEIDYYNPIVNEWNEEKQLKEIYERQTSDFVLYVITSGLKGVYSIAEVVDDSNKRPEKTLFCVLYDNIEKKMASSLKAVEKLVKSNGAVVLSSLEEIAVFLNNNN